MKNRILLTLLGLFCCNASIVLANDNYQVHGFLTQGFTYTTDNNFFGESSDNGSFEFTEIGINISGNLAEQVFGSAQLISRTTGAFYDGSPEIDYAMLDFNLVNENQWIGGLRIGRTKNPYGLYNDGRDAAVTRNGILLPQSIYFDKVRNLIMHGDGIQAYADINMDNADLFIQSSYGYSEMGENVEHTYLGADFPGEMEENDPLWVTRLIYEFQGGKFRLGYTKILGDMKYRPGSFDPITAGTVDFDQDIFSFEYNQEYWSFTAEYMQQDIDWRNLSVMHDNNDHVADGFYFQGTFQTSDKTELFIRYDESHVNRGDKYGKQAAMRPLAGPAFAHYAKDWTVGYRWDVTKDLMLRAEYHNVEGTSWLSQQEIPFSSMKKNWEMLNLLVSWHF